MTAYKPVNDESAENENRHRYGVVIRQKPVPPGNGKCHDNDSDNS